MGIIVIVKNKNIYKFYKKKILYDKYLKLKLSQNIKKLKNFVLIL